MLSCNNYDEWANLYLRVGLFDSYNLYLISSYCVHEGFSLHQFFFVFDLLAIIEIVIEIRIAVRIRLGDPEDIILVRSGDYKAERIVISFGVFY